MTTKSDARSGMETPRRIACLLASEFEDSELEVPLNRLRDAGYDVDIIGAKVGETLKGHKGRVSARVTRSIDEARVGDYAGLLIPGGHSPDKLRADPRFVKLVQEFDRSARPLAAVCHGPQLLLTAGLVKGRTLTAWKTVQSDLWQAGAHVQDEPVVVDENWITSRQPDDLDAFSAKLLEALAAPEARASSPPPSKTPAP
jgi:protease I